MAGDWQNLKALVVGCGSIGRRHARVLREIGVKTVFGCDPVPAQVAVAAKEARFDAVAESFEAALALRPDAVFLCTPPALHVPQAVQALDAGCHVFSEKPLSASLEGLDALEDLVARTGRKFMVGLCFRYHQGLLRARRMLDEGRIGRLVSIRALMGEHLPDIRPDYRDLYLAKYNGAFELMHDLDLAIWYAGREPQRVHGVHGGFSDIGIEAPDLVEILLEFPDRCVASIHLDFFQLPRRRQIELLGTRGTITVEFASWNECTVSVFDADRRVWAAEKLATDRDDMFRDEDRGFLRAVAEDVPIACTLAEGAKSLRVVLQAQGRRMTSRQRVAGVLRGVIPDRVPIGEYAIDCDTVERVVGHETFLRAKAKCQVAFWDGRRDEVAQSWEEDLVELHRRLPMFDIVNLASQATALLPPAGLPRVRYRKPDDATYVLDTGDVYRYSEATRDLTLVERGRAAEDGSPQGAASAAAAPDPSCFEVYDALIAALPEKYLVGCSGPEVGLVELGDTEQTLLAYALEPERAEEEARRQLAAANTLDRLFLRRGIQAVLWGQDHAYLSGPLASPEMFRRLALPVYVSRVRSVKSIMDIPIIKHACGNTWQLLDMYVEAGFDAYQSIQASAAMDLAGVKRAYGDRLVLWGGVPLELLQGGTTGEVRAAVRAAVEIGRPGGRYILGSSHSIAVGSKYDNVMAMLDEYERVADYYKEETWSH